MKKKLIKICIISLGLFLTSNVALAITIGALGDSITDEYLGTGATLANGMTDFAALNWVQILAQTRSSYIDFGALITDPSVYGEPRNEGYEYNWARAAATALTPGIIDTFAGITGTDVTSQAAGLATSIASGEVEMAYVGIGSNDYFVRDGFGGLFPGGAKPFSGDDYDAWEADLVGTILGSVDTLLGANPDSPPDIVLGLIPSGTAGANDSQELLDAIDHANSLLIAGAEDRGIAIVDLFAWTDDSNRYDVDGNLLIGDLVIDPLSNVTGDDLVPEGTEGAGPCDSLGNCAGPTHAEKFGADGYGHPNTAPSGLIANEFLKVINEYYGTDIPLLTDNEIVSLTGYQAAEVPLPSAFGFLIMGLTGLMLFRQKRNHR